MLLLTLLTLLAIGCATRPPSIAHVHIGHAVTAARDTPDKVGYLSIAERRAQEAYDLAKLARSEPSLDQLKMLLGEIQNTVNGVDSYSLVESVQEVENHIKYSATSDDASENVRLFAQSLSSMIEPVVSSSRLISLFVSEANGITDITQMQEVTEAIYLACETNWGRKSASNATGVFFLRNEIDDMIARENPPYATVDRWYLFNIFRLGNGSWIFRSPKGDTNNGSY